MTKLEKKWWYVGAVSLLTALMTIPLAISAGIWPITNIAQFVVYFLCFVLIARILAFLGTLVLAVSYPSSKLLD